MVVHSDGRKSYLCSLCDSRVRSSRRGKRVTDDEVRGVVDRGHRLERRRLWGLNAVLWSVSGRIRPRLRPYQSPGDS